MKKALVWTLSGVAAAGLVGTGVAAWALMQPAAPAADKPVDGIIVDAQDVPALYTGDELQWLIPDDAVLTELAGATGFAETEAAYGAIGESEGFSAMPEQCTDLVFEDFSTVVGQRVRGFETTGTVGGGVRVLQFGSAEAASAWAAPRFDLGASGECASYEWGQFSVGGTAIDRFSYEVVADEKSDIGGAEARTVVARRDNAGTGEWDDDDLTATMLYGNTVTIVSITFRDTIDVDADALAAALRSQAAAAHENLTGALR